MKKSNKILIRMTAVFLISCMMQQQTAYAASQTESSDTTAVFDGGDAEKDTSGIKGSVEGSSDQNTNLESGDVSGQDGNGQQEENSNQDTGEQQEENLNQDVDGQQEENQDQNVDNLISDGSQGDDGQTDQNEEEVADDDEWAEGDDEWTEAWTGADDEMEGNEWEDNRNTNEKEENNKNKDKGSEPATVSVNNIEPYESGEGYNVQNQGLSVSSKSSRAVLDQNYQTGAGLGNDLFLILAVVCGITAIGLSARKRKH